MRKILDEIQDVTQSAVATAFVFIIDLLSGAAVSYQYYFYFFIGGVFYIRLRMINSEPEAVQKRLKDRLRIGSFRSFMVASAAASAQPEQIRSTGGA